VLAVVDREEGGREAIEREGLPVRALFTASELKRAAMVKKG
jgi:orotate phosphoribosyltransferase